MNEQEAPSDFELEEFQDWLDRELSSATVNKYRRDVQIFLEWTGDESRLDPLSAAVLKDWLSDRSSEGLSDSTLARKRAAVRKFGKWLEYIDRVDRNPFVESDPDSHSVDLNISEQEVLQFVRKAERHPNVPDDLALAIRISYCTGLPVGEVVELEIEDVQLDKQQLVLPENEEDEARSGVFDSQTQQLLNEHLAQLKGKSGLLFTSHRGDPLDEKWIKRCMQVISESCGIQLTPQDLHQAEEVHRI